MIRKNKIKFTYKVKYSGFHISEICFRECSRYHKICDIDSFFIEMNIQEIVDHLKNEKNKWSIEMRLILKKIQLLIIFSSN